MGESTDPFTTTKISRTGFGRRPKPKQSRGILRRLLGFVSGLVWLVLATCLFFGALAGASYYVLGRYVRGETIPAPDLTARSVMEAMAIAREHSLSIEFDREEPSEALAEGEILSQRPKPGEMIKARTPIRVVVSSGPRQTILPDQLVGQTRLQVGITLRELELDLGNVAFLPAAPGQNPDVVLATDPPPGTGVPRGSKVNVLVAAETSTRSYSMPDLYGLTLEQANLELSRLGLRVNSVKEDYAAGALGGSIHAQQPAPGMPVSGESQIEVTVAPES